MLLYAEASRAKGTGHEAASKGREDDENGGDDLVEVKVGNARIRRWPARKRIAHGRTIRWMGKDRWCRVCSVGFECPSANGARRAAQVGGDRGSRAVQQRPRQEHGIDVLLWATAASWRGGWLCGGVEAGSRDIVGWVLAVLRCRVEIDEHVLQALAKTLPLDAVGNKMVILVRMSKVDSTHWQART